MFINVKQEEMWPMTLKGECVCTGIVKLVPTMAFVDQYKCWIFSSTFHFKHRGHLASY